MHRHQWSQVLTNKARRILRVDKVVDHFDGHLNPSGIPSTKRLMRPFLVARGQWGNLRAMGGRLRVR